MSELRKFEYGHNLNSLLEELQKKEVQVSEDTVSLIDGLHEQHKNHALRYSALMDDGRAIFLPTPEQAFGMLDELLLLTRISTQGV